MNYREPRWPVDEAVYVVTPTGTVRAQLRNVGAQGMSFATSAVLRRGQAIRVVAVGREIEARVLWARGSSAGVRLQAALSTEDLTILRKLPRGHIQTQNRPARGFTAGRFSEL